MATVFYPLQPDYIEKLNELWDMALAGGGGANFTNLTVTAPLQKSGSSSAATLSIPAADANTNGYMTSTQAAKLAGIAANATAYALPISTASVLGGVKIGAGIQVTADGVISAAFGTGGNPGTVTNVIGASGSPITVINGTTIPQLDINVASQSAKGAMSTTDKIKLDMLTPVSVSSNPPVNPYIGQEWVDPEIGIALVWYSDGVTSAWLEV